MASKRDVNKAARRWAGEWIYILLNGAMIGIVITIVWEIMKSLSPPLQEFSAAAAPLSAVTDQYYNLELAEGMGESLLSEVMLL